MTVYISVDEGVNLLGISKSLFHRQRRAGKFTCREIKVNGGVSYEISLDSLPEYAQDKYQKELSKKTIENLPEPLKQIVENDHKNALPALQKPMSHFTEKQRDVDLAINTLMRWIRAYPGKPSQAIDALNAGWQMGTLDNVLVSALNRSRIKKSGCPLSKANILTVSTFEKWVIRYRDQGNFIPHQRGKDMAVYEWYETAVSLYGRPQKPTIEWVTEQLASMFAPAPSYWAVRRFLTEKYSAGDLLKGRNTGMQLKAKQYHKKRSSKACCPGRSCMQTVGRRIFPRRIRLQASLLALKSGIFTMLRPVMCRRLRLA